MQSLSWKIDSKPKLLTIRQLQLKKRQKTKKYRKTPSIFVKLTLFQRKKTHSIF